MREICLEFSIQFELALPRSCIHVHTYLPLSMHHQGMPLHAGLGSTTSDLSGGVKILKTIFYISHPHCHYYARHKMCILMEEPIAEGVMTLNEDSSIT